MTKRVLDVGQCPPDHAAIRHLLSGQFGAEVIQAHQGDDTLAALRQATYDLVLVNRKLDRDYTDGLEIIKQIKADPDLQHTPCMLVTNYAEHQQAAVEAGAEYGFGKAELNKPETRERLQQVLGPLPATNES